LAVASDIDRDLSGISRMTASVRDRFLDDSESNRVNRVCEFAHVGRNPNRRDRMAGFGERRQRGDAMVRCPFVASSDVVAAVGALSIAGASVATHGAGELTVHGEFAGRDLNRLLIEVGVFADTVARRDQTLEQAFLTLTGA
jgi:hypothetical protein